MIYPSSYLELPEKRFYRLCSPEQQEESHIPEYLCWDEDLATELEIGEKQEWRDLLAGRKVESQNLGLAPSLAMAYAGHQFDHFVPQLGDGRALMLGELTARDGKRYDLQLKGSGRTPFSRGGDGRLPFRAALKEFFYCKAMHALGVPTSRSLAVLSTGSEIFRDVPPPPSHQKAVVLSRLASSHLRIGSLEYLACRQDSEGIKLLIDYLIKHNYPELQKVCPQERTLHLARSIIARLAKLAALWQSIGFVHGVLNTDNTSLVGETIDYGPCAFLGHYRPEAVFSSIDHYGRYAYKNQPEIIAWNLGSMLHCLSEKTELLSEYWQIYNRQWQTKMLAKLGYNTDQGLKLLEDFLQILQEEQLDYNYSFYQLRTMLENGKNLGSPALKDWRERWLESLCQVGQRETAAVLLQNNNPCYIPRNSWLEEAITQAQQGDWQLYREFLAVFQNPYRQTSGDKFLSDLPQRDPSTYCGT